LDFNLFIDLFLHLDEYLNAILSQYNVLAYVLIFVVIFIETGLVVTPFLPGDSLIFVTGAIAAAGGPINIPLMIGLLYAAAVSGDTVNYHIGHFLREKVRRKEKIPFIKAEYIERTQAFFNRHGGKTITIARFIPIIRTFAPFVAGVCKMAYHKFLSYNVVGGISWVTLMFCIGYFFGNIPYIKDHFGLIVVGIVVISVLPAVIAFLVNRRKTLKEGEEA
jgi:membrane-associated protein